MILSLKHPRRGRSRKVKGLLRNLYLNLGNYHLSIFLASNKCSNSITIWGNWVHTGIQVAWFLDLKNFVQLLWRKSIIGKGGFGTVYKGTVRGSLTVAIQFLNNVAVARCMHDMISLAAAGWYIGQSLKIRWNQKSPTLQGINRL